jgi:hypothetical protein
MMAQKVVFSATIKELKINTKGLVPVFNMARLVAGTVGDAVNMAHNETDLKITIEPVQPGFFDEPGEAAEKKPINEER